MVWVLSDLDIFDSLIFLALDKAKGFRCNRMESPEALTACACAVSAAHPGFCETRVGECGDRVGTQWSAPQSLHRGCTGFSVPQTQWLRLVLFSLGSHPSDSIAATLVKLLSTSADQGQQGSTCQDLVHFFFFSIAVIMLLRLQFMRLLIAHILLSFK